MAELVVARRRIIFLVIGVLALGACSQATNVSGTDGPTTSTTLAATSSTAEVTTSSAVDQTTTSTGATQGDIVYLVLIRAPSAEAEDQFAELEQIREQSPQPEPPLISAVVDVACFLDLWRYVFEGHQFMWVVWGPDSEQVLDYAGTLVPSGFDPGPIIETVDQCRAG